MTRRLSYLVVEGPHDVEFAIRLIQSQASFVRVQNVDTLDETFKKLVPDKFPHGGDLLKRVPVPVFLQNDSSAIAIHAAGGDSKIAPCLEDTILLLGIGVFSAIGVILDSDSKDVPKIRCEKLLKEVKDLPLVFSNTPAELLDVKPKTGIYVLPDNATQGTLEDLLLECGEIAYSNQLKAARTFVDDVLPHCEGQDFKDLRLAAGQNKAIIGAVAGLLRPGKAVQVSIQDNGWLKGNALQCERVKNVVDFLDKLFELTAQNIIAVN